MPLYEYHCGKCGHRFEVMLTVAEMTDTRACPRCDYPALKVINFQGRVFTDDAPWLRDAAEILSTPVKTGRVEATRAGIRRHCEKHGIEPAG